MCPLFSPLGRSISLIRQPFAVMRLSTTPSEAVARCVGLWRTAKIRAETPGMREQYSRMGWVGTELVIGHNRKAFFANILASSGTVLAISALCPQVVPNRIKRSFVEKTFIEVIARAVPDSKTLMCELWCRIECTSVGESNFPEDYLASMLEKIERSFRQSGILVSPMERPTNLEVPADVPLTVQTLTALRKAAKKCNR